MKKEFSWTSALPRPIVSQCQLSPSGVILGATALTPTRSVPAATQHFRVNTYPFAIAADNG